MFANKSNYDRKTAENNYNDATAFLAFSGAKSKAEQALKEASNRNPWAKFYWGMLHKSKISEKENADIYQKIIIECLAETAKQQAEDIVIAELFVVVRKELLSEILWDDFVSSSEWAFKNAAQNWLSFCFYYGLIKQIEFNEISQFVVNKLKGLSHQTVSQNLIEFFNVVLASSYYKNNESVQLQLLDIIADNPYLESDFTTGTTLVCLFPGGSKNKNYLLSLIDLYVIQMSKAVDVDVTAQYRKKITSIADRLFQKVPLDNDLITTLAGIPDVKLKLYLLGKLDHLQIQKEIQLGLCQSIINHLPTVGFDQTDYEFILNVLSDIKSQAVMPENKTEAKKQYVELLLRTKNLPGITPVSNAKNEAEANLLELVAEDGSYYQQLYQLYYYGLAKISVRSQEGFEKAIWAFEDYFNYCLGRKVFSDQDYIQEQLKELNKNLLHTPITQQHLNEICIKISAYQFVFNNIPFVNCADWFQKNIYLKACLEQIYKLVSTTDFMTALNKLAELVEKFNEKDIECFKDELLLLVESIEERVSRDDQKYGDYYYQLGKLCQVIQKKSVRLSVFSQQAESYFQVAANIGYLEAMVAIAEIYSVRKGGEKLTKDYLDSALKMLNELDGDHHELIKQFLTICQRVGNYCYTDFQELLYWSALKRKPEDLKAYIDLERLYVDHFNADENKLFKLFSHIVEIMLTRCDDKSYALYDNKSLNDKFSRVTTLFSKIEALAAEGKIILRENEMRIYRERFLDLVRKSSAHCEVLGNFIVNDNIPCLKNNLLFIVDYYLHSSAIDDEGKAILASILLFSNKQDALRICLEYFNVSDNKLTLWQNFLRQLNQTNNKDKWTPDNKALVVKALSLTKLTDIPVIDLCLAWVNSGTLNSISKDIFTNALLMLSEKNEFCLFADNLQRHASWTLWREVDKNKPAESLLNIARNFSAVCGHFYSETMREQLAEKIFTELKDTQDKKIKSFIYLLMARHWQHVSGHMSIWARVGLFGEKLSEAECYKKAVLLGQAVAVKGFLATHKTPGVIVATLFQAVLNNPTNSELIREFIAQMDKYVGKPRSFTGVVVDVEKEFLFALATNNHTNLKKLLNNYPAKCQALIKQIEQWEVIEEFKNLKDNYLKTIQDARSNNNLAVPLGQQLSAVMTNSMRATMRYSVLDKSEIDKLKSSVITLLEIHLPELFKQWVKPINAAETVADISDLLQQIERAHQVDMNQVRSLLPMVPNESISLPMTVNTASDQSMLSQIPQPSAPIRETVNFSTTTTSNQSMRQTVNNGATVYPKIIIDGRDLVLELVNTRGITSAAAAELLFKDVSDLKKITDPITEEIMQNPMMARTYIDDQAFVVWTYDQTTFENFTKDEKGNYISPRNRLPMTNPEPNIELKKLIDEFNNKILIRFKELTTPLVVESETSNVQKANEGQSNSYGLVVDTMRKQSTDNQSIEKDSSAVIQPSDNSTIVQASPISQPTDRNPNNETRQVVYQVDAEQKLKETEEPPRKRKQKKQLVMG